MTAATLPELDLDACWRAVATRDARLDGTLYYAVRSTGVYCRPSCPARRPRRERVAFFASADAAEQAGFRACLRCRPRERRADVKTSLVDRACRAIEAAAPRIPTLNELGAALETSPFHLQRTFRTAVGVTPRAYAMGLRADRFRSESRSGTTLLDAMFGAGYGSSSRLYENSNAELGMTPASYARGGAGASIAYTVARCDLGLLLVAATERGLCAVRLGDSATALERALRDEFPHATIRRDPGALAVQVEAVLRQLAGEPATHALPLDVRATAFQRRVWTHLRSIPPGEVRSYAEVASAIGSPRAARAVARACATNPVGVVIPCHRVVQGSGAPGGYLWGVSRKRALLDRERSRRSS